MFKNLFAALLLTGILSPCSSQRLKRPPLALEACLDSLPGGAGAKYAVALLVAVPDTARPRALLTWPRVRLGHVFLGLFADDGVRRRAVYVGFYARSPALAFTTGVGVASRLVDNAGHRYDGVVVRRVDSNAWRAILAQLRADAAKRYSVLGYNCVHFSLDVFNAASAHPLKVPLMRLPGEKTGGHLTPNGVYIQIQSMRFTDKDVVLRHGMAADFWPADSAAGRRTGAMPVGLRRP